MIKDDVFVVSKPLQYINVLNIDTKRNKILLIIDSFKNSESFFLKLKTSDSNWKYIFYFKTVYDSFDWILKNKNKIQTLFIDSDINYKRQFYLLRKLNITVYEEGVGSYRKKQHKPRTLTGKIFLYFQSIVGFKNRRGGGRYTSNIIVYNPDFYKTYLNETKKNVSGFTKPFRDHIFDCKNLSVFNNKPNLDFCKNKTVALLLSSWDLSSDHLNYLKEIDCNIKLFKPHPNIKENFENDLAYIDLILPNEIPAEIILSDLIELSKKVILISSYSSTSVYFLKEDNLQIINLKAKETPFNDQNSYYDAYNNLSDFIINNY